MRESDGERSPRRNPHLTGRAPGPINPGTGAWPDAAPRDETHHEPGREGDGDGAGTAASSASTGSAWEPIVGYSRAVRIGDTIAVTGSVGLEADGSFAPDLQGADAAGPGDHPRRRSRPSAAKEDVIRTRIYVTDIAQWQEVGEAHGEVFGEIRPATTMVEVARLIDAAALVEIEADAIARPGGTT